MEATSIKALHDGNVSVFAGSEALTVDFYEQRVHLTVPTSESTDLLRLACRMASEIYAEEGNFSATYIAAGPANRVGRIEIEAWFKRDADGKAFKVVFSVSREDLKSLAWLLGQLEFA